MAFMSEKKAKTLYLILFLLGLAVLAWLKTWWPAILLVVSLPLALLQFLRGKLADTLMSLVIFGGVFIVVQFHISLEFLFPALLTLGALYIFFREFLQKE